MYKHSFKERGPWQGEYEHPQQALDAGRAMYGDVTRVYVGKMEPAHFSDMFMGGVVLLSYMQEVAEDYGDDFAQSIEDLPHSFKRGLGAYVEYAIEEWESDLPEELQFKGEIIKKSKGYTASAMVRPLDFK